MKTNTPARCKGIALYMRNHARQLGLDPHAAAMVGWNSEASILFDDLDTTGVADLLDDDHYRFAYELRWQGDPKGLRSSMGVLLNIALLSVGDDGAFVGMDATLTAIKAEYGADSAECRRIRNLIDLIRDTREWELLEPDNVDLVRLTVPIPKDLRADNDGEPTVADGPREPLGDLEFPPTTDPDRENELDLPDFLDVRDAADGKPVTQPDTGCALDTGDAPDDGAPELGRKPGPIGRFLRWLGIIIEPRG